MVGVVVVGVVVVGVVVAGVVVVGVVVVGVVVVGVVVVGAGCAPAGAVPTGCIGGTSKSGSKLRRSWFAINVKRSRLAEPPFHARANSAELMLSAE